MLTDVFNVVTLQTVQGVLEQRQCVQNNRFGFIQMFRLELIHTEFGDKCTGRMESEFIVADRIDDRFNVFNNFGLLFGRHETAAMYDGRYGVLGFFTQFRFGVNGINEHMIEQFQC